MAALIVLSFIRLCVRFTLECKGPLTTRALSERPSRCVSEGMGSGQLYQNNAIETVELESAKSSLKTILTVAKRDSDLTKVKMHWTGLFTVIKRIRRSKTGPDDPSATLFVMTMPKTGPDR